MHKPSRSRITGVRAFSCHFISLFSEDGITIFEPKSFLKNAASFWKKPAFEVSCCEAVISFPFASLTALPFLSTTFAAIVAEPLAIDSTAQVTQLRWSVHTAFSSLNLNALEPETLHSTVVPSGNVDVSMWSISFSPYLTVSPSALRAAPSSEGADPTES